MKTFRSYLSEFSELKFIYENMIIRSSIGRKKMLDTLLMSDEKIIKENIDFLDSFLRCFIKFSENKKELILKNLERINDISLIIRNLYKEANADDIQLFEIKKFAILCQEISNLLKEKDCDVIKFHDLYGVIKLLDPEKSGLISFYVYDAYDHRLAELRKKRLSSNSEEEAQKLFIKCLEIEDKIRKEICENLKLYLKDIEENLSSIANLDVLISKVELINKFNLTKPKICKDRIVYKSLFNPYIDTILKKSGRSFQPVDIELQQQACLITGANMSGKTVLLKTLAVSQLMCQFGFFVPAQYAEIMPVEEILVSIGEKQDEINGLSSFAAEMLDIDNIIKNAKKQKKILALVDELARTTNPDEGKAIVNAFISLMEKYKTCCVITTHYSGIKTSSKRLRVIGLQNFDPKVKLTPENINNYMNYNLMEVTDDIVPTEALRIIEILGVDTELLKKSRNFLISHK